MGQINIALPEELHRSLKVAAAQRGVTLKQLVVERVVSFVDRSSSSRSLVRSSSSLRGGAR